MKLATSGPVITTRPSSEPLTIEEAKKHLEIASSETAHDDQLFALIRAAREQWEHDTDTCLLTQTLQMKAGRFVDRLRLLKRPIQSITSIVYYDTANALQTLDTSIYNFDADNREVRLQYDQVWPSTVDRWDAVTITYIAGHTDRVLVPQIAKQAMLLLVGHYFENRDMLMSDAITSMKAYEALVMRFMRSTYP